MPQYQVSKKFRSKIHGPYPAKKIRHYFLLGRIRSTDEVSSDGGRTWEPLSQVPELVPDELLGKKQMFRNAS